MSAPIVWLHHSRMDYYTDSDEETTDDYVVGSYCAHCETEQATYCILDRTGKRLPNPFIAHMRKHDDYENYSDPQVPFHVKCQDMLLRFGICGQEMHAIKNEFLKAHLLSDICVIACSYLYDSRHSFLEFVAHMAPFT